VLYRILPEEIKALPTGTEYRILSRRTDLFNECFVIESKGVLGLIEQENSYPNGVAILDDGCLASWEVANGE
jgi:hypothetical protein